MVLLGITIQSQGFMANNKEKQMQVTILIKFEKRNKVGNYITNEVTSTYLCLKYSQPGFYVYTSPSFYYFINCEYFMHFWKLFYFFFVILYGKSNKQKFLAFHIIFEYSYVLFVGRFYLTYIFI